jgi:DNA-binding response OmpR family regulator
MSAPPKPSILIVEDDVSIASGLQLNLGIEGYDARIAGDGKTALTAFREREPSLIVLDIGLPRASGLEVLRELRAGGHTTPVIVLSARQEEFDKVAALRLGADDYVTKPFALAELLARITAVLRRSTRAEPKAAPPASPPPTELRFDDVVVNPDTRSVSRAGRAVSMTHLEFELLTHFVRNPRRAFSREQLLRAVWGVHHSGPARTVDNFVAQLRSKLEDDADSPRHFVTVRGTGYRFDP